MSLELQLYLLRITLGFCVGIVCAYLFLWVLVELGDAIDRAMGLTPPKRRKK